jgi:hypothetical protein
LRSIGKQSDDVAPHGVAAWAEAWARIRAKLRDEVGDVEFRSWLRQMTLAAVEVPYGSRKMPRFVGLICALLPAPAQRLVMPWKMRRHPWRKA